MNRRLISPPWLLLHLLFVVAASTTGFLTWWQWDRAQEAGGSFQNLGYALQWPLFGLFTLFLWYRVVRMYQYEQANSSSATASEPVSKDVAPSERTDQRQEQHDVAQPERKRSLVPPPASPVTDDEDPELAAYNQYLTELHANERARD